MSDTAALPKAPTMILCNTDSMEERSAFAGGDQEYLRDTQYGDGSKLDVRTRLHRMYSLSEVVFPDFEAALIDWPDQADVLECGCGTGNFWDSEVVPKSLSLTLTDLSPGMVDQAVGKAKAKGFESVIGQECDVQSLPYDDDSYDIVLANHMLYHVPDPDKALAEISRVLRPGGKLLASTNGYGHMGLIIECVAETIADHGEGLYKVFGIESGEELLRNHFATVAWHAYDNDLLVDDPAAVVAYALSFPPGETATAEQADALTRAIESRFVNGKARIRTRTGSFVCSDPRDLTVNPS